MKCRPPCQREALVGQQVVHLERLVARHVDLRGVQREEAPLGVVRVEVDDRHHDIAAIVGTP